MPPDPRGAALDALLRRLVRRIWIRDAAHAAAVAGLCGAVVSALLLPSGRGFGVLLGSAAAVAAAGVMLWRSASGRSSRAAAARLERAHPELRNLIVTAQELRAYPERASAWMRDRVLAEAASRAGALRARDVVHIARPLILVTAAAATWAGAVLGLPARAATAVREAAARGSASHPVARSGELTFTAELRPPQYTAVPPRNILNPDRIDAIAGTALRLWLRAGDEAWRVRFGSASLPLRREGRDLVAETMLSESGYFAIEPEGHDGKRLLLPVSVTPDRAPTIRMDAPARDLLLPVSATRLAVSASATDDFALQSLELRYTKVSGTGEQFEFEEGTVPLALTRDTERAWKGRVDLALPALKLAPGDALVYRAVGRDRRPGDAGLASSDTFFVEIQGPGQIALEGMEMPPDAERYALSQQMVVLKIQRLREREASMARPAVEEATASIAAEQRAVRANFIFLTGGHVEDEFEEAEHSNEIQEGRLENSARKDISAAIHQMTLAEQGLTAVNTGRALPRAKSAVDALQRAFGRNRYILRTLASRSRIDPSRRLTGELKAAGDWRRDLSPATPDRATREARALLSRALGVAGALHAGRDVAPAAVAVLAEQALAVGPGSSDWQGISAGLMRLRDALAAKQPTRDIVRRLNEAIGPLVAIAQKDARQPEEAGTAPAGSLLSAWAEEKRR